MEANLGVAPRVATDGKKMDKGMAAKKDTGSENRKPDRALVEAVRSLKAVLIPTAVFSFAINLLLFASPLYMMQVYDRVLTSRSGATLIALSAIAAFLVALMGTLELIRSRVLVRAGMRFDEALRDSLFDAVGEAELKAPRTGAARHLGDADKIREFVAGTGVTGFIDAPWAPLFVILCYFLHPWIGFLALAGAVAVLLLALLSEVTTGRSTKEASDASRSLALDASDAFRNIESIRALGMRRAVLSRWAAAKSELIARHVAVNDMSGTIMAISKFVRILLQVAVLGVGAWLAILDQLSPGAMIAASMLLGRAMAPVDQAVSNWKGFVAARASFARLKSLFGGIPGPPDRIELPSPSGRVTVSDLFVVPPGSVVPGLKGVTFSAEPGEILAVVGPSAAGKSTLLRALVGVWPASSGSVRIDGYELDQWDSDVLGARLGYLPQDVDLFHDTLARNIARLGDGEDAAIIEAATKAGIHETIQSFPDGYATRIGHGGLILSGGQRQRVALARALYGNPALLVLDEPNSNLDGAGEQALMRALRQVRASGATVIVTTHKPSLLAISDKVVVLGEGTVKRFGPRDTILPSILGSRPPAGQRGGEGFMWRAQAN